MKRQQAVDSRYDEALSALIDGELTTEALVELVERLVSTPELQRQWHHHHLMRDLMQPQPNPPLRPHFSAQVMQRLESEPTVLIPPRRRPWMAGYGIPVRSATALVASIAAVMVVGGLFLTLDRGTATRPIVAQGGGMPLPVVVSAEAVAAIEHQRMESYLARHVAKSPSSQMRSFLPYARVVSYNGGQE